MINRAYCTAICIAVIAAAGSMPVRSETLLVERVEQERGVTVPTRGMTMARVEHDFGAPTSKLTPAGGDSSAHPVINRWVYDRFTVYFERDRVIDTVVNHASPTEIGPKGSNPGQ